MPPGSPPRGGESARLRPPGDPPPPSFGTFDGVARGGKSGDDAGSDDAGIFDTEDFAGGVDASPDAELEVEIVRGPPLARAQRAGAARCDQRATQRI